MNFLFAVLLFSSLVDSVASDKTDDLAIQVGNQHEVFTSEIEQMKVQFQMLQDAVAKHHERVVFSRHRVNRDRGTVVATCPPTYRLVACGAHGTEYTDGSLVNGKCYARHSLLSHREPYSYIKAQATCAPESIVGVPQYSASVLSTNPSVQCSVGYRLIACLIQTWYGEKYTTLPKGKIENNRCVSDQECLKTSKCKASIICLKI